MGVNRSGLPRFNTRIEDTHAFILLQQVVLLWRRHERIEARRLKGRRHVRPRILAPAALTLMPDDSSKPHA